ncbi:DUF7009 family protein [Christiangramia sp. OXR-203]|uniref:DUF7009 family protein n=1 Tax=Christiangramia sp. OXR-203 TaxID=3100176 RepID=UPI002AC9D641|nr:hypothetical protein [Christiangramia sp. OXR-203]WPY99832.1 hypothetical protein T8I65_06360 [Christiangramia sp. OXR-203]
MKIRIRGNSVRYRLTKNEVEQLCTKGSIEEITNFPNLDFAYEVKVATTEQLNIHFANNKISLEISDSLIENWETNNRVGFSHTLVTSNGKTIDILLEKDFTCLEDRGEDESNNYPNPKSLAL